MTTEKALSGKPYMATIVLAAAVVALGGCCTAPSCGDGKCAKAPPCAWSGKRVAVFGDSISDARLKMWRHWWQWVADELGTEMSVYASNGRQWNDVPRQVDEMTKADGAEVDIKVGNALPLSNIPTGTFVHNVELYPGRGGQLARSAGNAAQLMAKEGRLALLRLPSGELRNVPATCMATIGTVSNEDHANVKIGKAGRTRHMGIRPTVRGSVMNPCDHPHGGGEGKSPIGRPGPVTPWGKPALGYKTRNRKKKSTKLIVKRVNDK